MYAELSKNENTWYRVLGHLICQIRYNPESIQRMVVRKAFYTQTATRTATSAFAISTGTASSGTRTTTGSTTTGAASALRFCAQLTSFLSLSWESFTYPEFVEGFL